MISRAGILVLCLLATHGYITNAVRNRPLVPRAPLAELPLSIRGWTGRDDPVDRAVLQTLRLDDHVNRTYQRQGTAPVNLYIGYYGGVRTGNTHTPHPPMVCLPGQGWQPIETGQIVIGTDHANAAPFTASRYVVDNGRSQFLLLFWYQINDRAIAGELRSKLFLFADGLTARGTDSALVRVAVPTANRGSDAIASAEREAIEFVRTVQPLIATHFPGAGPRGRR